MGVGWPWGNMEVLVEFVKNVDNPCGEEYTGLQVDLQVKLPELPMVEAGP